MTTMTQTAKVAGPGLLRQFLKRILRATGIFDNERRSGSLDIGAFDGNTFLLGLRPAAAIRICVIMRRLKCLLEA